MILATLFVNAIQRNLKPQVDRGKCDLGSLHTGQPSAGRRGFWFTATEPSSWIPSKHWTRGTGPQSVEPFPAPAVLHIVEIYGRWETGIIKLAIFAQAASCSWVREELRYSKRLRLLVIFARWPQSC